MEAEAADAVQGVETVGHLHRGGLGDLDGHLFGVEVEVAQSRLDLGDAVATVELRGCRVDRDAERDAAFVPCSRVHTRLAEYLAPQCAGESRCVGDGGDPVRALMTLPAVWP